MKTIPLLMLLPFLIGCDATPTVSTPTPPAVEATPEPPVVIERLHGKNIKQTFNAKCIAITDGDTIAALINGNEQIKIRLDSIDASEMKKSQTFCKRSKQALSDLVFGKQIQVRDTGTKSWERRLAFVSIDGKDVNAAMVESGFAWNFPKK